jgi:tetratricopeptide (TPR) repeat protein
MPRLSFTLLLLLAPGLSTRSLASPASDAGAPVDSEAQDRDDKLLTLKAILARYPKDPDANFNIGVLYQLKEQPERALRHFETVVKEDPEDWHSIARLVQVNQALGKLKARDGWRSRLLTLYAQDKVVYPNAQVATVFCRDQFRLGSTWVMALESYAPRGPRPVRYSFEVLSKSEGGQKLRTLTLGAAPSPDAGTSFHLVGHWPDGTDVTYRAFASEPSYDAVREAVLAILRSEPPKGAGPPAKP